MIYKRPINASEKCLILEVFLGCFRAATCKLDWVSVLAALKVWIVAKAFDGQWYLCPARVGCVSVDCFCAKAKGINHFRAVIQVKVDKCKGNWPAWGKSNGWTDILMEDRDINDPLDTLGNDKFFSNSLDCKEQNEFQYHINQILEWL